MNPYKDANPAPELRRITGEVGFLDWSELYKRVPKYGIQDVVISQLFSKFIKAYLETNPPLPQTENEFHEAQARFNLFISGCSISPTSGDGL